MEEFENVQEVLLYTFAPCFQENLAALLVLWLIDLKNTYISDDLINHISSNISAHGALIHTLRLLHIVKNMKKKLEWNQVCCEKEALKVIFLFVSALTLEEKAQCSFDLPNIDH